MSSHDPFDLAAMQQAVNYKRHILKKISDSGAITDETLDLGAGRGDFAIAIKDRIGSSPICAEIDPVSVNFLVSAGLDVHQSPDTIPRIKGLYSINVLEHIQDPASFLAQYTRRLQSGSSVFIYVPAHPSLFSEWDQRVGHFHRFTRCSIEAVVSAAGLRVLQSGYSDPVGAFVTWLMKTLRIAGKPLSPASVRAFDRLAYPLSTVLEPVFREFMGKNVWVRAVKP